MVSSVKGSEDGESGALGWAAVNGSFPAPVGGYGELGSSLRCVGEGEEIVISSSRGGSDGK